MISEPVNAMADGQNYEAGQQVKSEDQKRRYNWFIELFFRFQVLKVNLALLANPRPAHFICRVVHRARIQTVSLKQDVRVNTLATDLRICCRLSASSAEANPNAFRAVARLFIWHVSRTTEHARLLIHVGK